MDFTRVGTLNVKSVGNQKKKCFQTMLVRSSVQERTLLRADSSRTPHGAVPSSKRCPRNTFFFHILPSLMVQHTISPSGRRVTVDRGITPTAEFLMQLVGIL